MDGFLCIPGDGAEGSQSGEGDVQIRGWEDRGAPGRFQFLFMGFAGTWVEGTVVRMDVGVAGSGPRQGAAKVG
jgi:hypothetical protein